MKRRTLCLGMVLMGSPPKNKQSLKGKHVHNCDAEHNPLYARKVFPHYPNPFFHTTLSRCGAPVKCCKNASEVGGTRLLFRASVGGTVSKWKSLVEMLATACLCRRALTTRVFGVFC